MIPLIEKTNKESSRLKRYERKLREKIKGIFVN